MKDKHVKFMKKHRHRRWYQPVIIEPGILEFRGAWHEATKHLAEHILDGVRNKSVLDVGCNTGFFLQEALKRGAKEAVGIDSDPTIIALGTEISNILNMHITFHCCDALDFLSDRPFDLILMLNILDFVDPACIKKYIQMGKRVIIEHNNHDILSPHPNHIGSSERAGGRKLSIFE